MGSKIRNSVGSNFEEALDLLQLEIEKRMKENERTTESSAASTAKRNKVQKKQGVTSSHKYALMAFSRDSCDNFSPVDKKLKICSDYASSTNFLQEKKDVLESYKHALLYSRHDKTSFVDHLAFICAFVKQLQDDASDDVTTLKNTERTIREFVSCLVLSEEVPASAASKVGELIGRYATVHFRLNSVSSVSDGQDQTKVGNAISMSMALLSFSAESIADFVAGYINYAMDRMKEEPRSKSLQSVFVSMAAALSRALLQCNHSALQNLRFPTVEKNLERNKAAANQFNDSKAQMTKLVKWTNEYVSSYSQGESNIQNEESDDGHEDDIANESEEDAEIEIEEDESDNASLRRSTRKRKGST